MRISNLFLLALSGVWYETSGTFGARRANQHGGSAQVLESAGRRRRSVLQTPFVRVDLCLDALMPLPCVLAPSLCLWLPRGQYLGSHVP